MFMDLPVITFLYSPEHITSSVVQSARNSGTGIIYDLSRTEIAAVTPAMLHAGATGIAVQLKIRPETLADSEAMALIRECAIATLWMELHPALTGDPERYLDAAAGQPNGCSVIPIIGDWELLEKALARPAIRRIALKGNEASGFVSSETTFALYSAARRRLSSGRDNPGLILWGGFGLPEAAAAFLAAGAKGIVFEHVHCLTDLVCPNDDFRQKFSGIRPDHTDLVGSALNVPCRLYNKGNSKAVKELREFASGLCGSEITDEVRRTFARRLQEACTPVYKSSLGRDELVPLGVEAAFAASFIRRFGQDTETALRKFVAAIDEALAAAPQKAGLFQKSPAAARMKTRYPFLQGAMSWITDNPEFAKKTADAGGLPTIALGMMDSGTLEKKLGNLSEIMGDSPYAVNVITLQENPFCEEQLAFIAKVRPKFAVIAAGDPSHAVKLKEAGIEPIYIAPDGELLQLAFRAGINYAICEGNEAGGHVGIHGTLTLAQIIMEARRRDPELFRGKTVILAGGIGNRETAFIASMLGADAVQMGTVYLTTREIVETVALSDIYRQMILSSRPAGTVVTGEGTGLQVRSLLTPKIEADPRT